ncbi:hypothetical protein F9B85_13055 [Heliorestis acidaminivorans]|uniref:Nuclear transport factor 2 family protein n=1 Tax=Heliorestis acidaminivorans TaxID=553427 RepID=A0A6I0EPU4_9FIRM|nr:hypothetical protein [Heliorestis acidaminivorans]KAB2951291.1 hypothetical protein F9B85_13055 [Heliorestis acidaminivorans]
MKTTNLLRFFPFLLLSLLLLTGCGAQDSSTSANLESDQVELSSPADTADLSDDAVGDADASAGESSASEDRDDKESKSENRATQKETLSVKERELAIINDYLYALSLEEKLHADWERWKSKEDVYKFFRQGYSEVISWRLADYSWADNIGLIATEGTMFMPDDDVHILEVDFDKKIASVWHFTSEAEQFVWGFDDYTVAELRYENGRWKVYESSHSDKHPRR